MMAPKATDHPGTNHTKIITKNVQGLRSEETWINHSSNEKYKNTSLPDTRNPPCWRLHQGNQQQLPPYPPWPRNPTYQRRQRWSCHNPLRKLDWPMEKRWLHYKNRTPKQMRMLQDFWQSTFPLPTQTDPELNQKLSPLQQSTTPTQATPTMKQITATNPWQTSLMRSPRTISW